MSTEKLSNNTLLLSVVINGRASPRPLIVEKRLFTRAECYFLK